MFDFQLNKSLFNSKDVLEAARVGDVARLTYLVEAGVTMSANSVRIYFVFHS